MSETLNEPRKAKKQRSPSYPAIDLPTALARAEQLFLAEGRNFAPVPSALKAWNYGPKSSGGLLAIAALKRFGLLEERGASTNREVRVTDLAYSIIVDNREDQTEKIRRFQEAALTPTIHRELWDEYNGDLPSDATLQYRLTTERDFTPSGAEEFVKQFRKTLWFARLDSQSSDFSEPEQTSLPDVDMIGTAVATVSNPPFTGATGATGPSSRPSARDRSFGGYSSGPTGAISPLGPPSAAAAFYNVPVAPGIVVTVAGPFPLESSQWDQMIAVLNAMKPALVAPDRHVVVSDSGTATESATVERQEAEEGGG